jgi:hypothetical protein
MLVNPTSSTIRRYQMPSEDFVGYSSVWAQQDPGKRVHFAHAFAEGNYVILYTRPESGVPAEFGKHKPDVLMHLMPLGTVATHRKL